MKQMTTSLRRHWNDTYYGNYAKIALLCQFQRFIVIDAEKKRLNDLEGLSSTAGKTQLIWVPSSVSRVIVF